MTRLLELSEKEDLLRLPQIDWHAVKLLWPSDYWDGPKSGMLMYQGKRYWFQVFEESNDADLSDFFRRFVILELTEEQLNEEEYWHKLFREKVGAHTDFDESGKRAIGALKPKEMWHEFYDAYQKRQEPDYSNNTVIGWSEV